MNIDLRPREINIAAYRGDTTTFQVSGDIPAGGTWTGQIRLNADAEAVLGVLTIFPAGDTLTVTVPPLWGRGVWDVQWTDGTEIKTIVRGTIEWTPDVTR